MIVMMALLLAATPPVPMPTAKATDRDYPDTVRKQGIQGDVEFALDVDKTGKPSACRVRQASGSVLLDRAACRAAMRWSFQPASNEKGEAVAGEFADWMSFYVRDGFSITADGYRVDVLFNHGGEITSCRVNRIIPEAVVSKSHLSLCTKMADRNIFSAYLGRSTQGLERASIRMYTLNNPQNKLTGNQDMTRRLGAVEFSQTDRGAITGCQTISPPEAPVSAPGSDFCALEQFKVTRPGSGTTKLFVIDAVATFAR